MSLNKWRTKIRKILDVLMDRDVKEECSPLAIKECGVMCKASEVGKIVVNECLDKGLFVNTQKLQKLLVLMQIECIKESKHALFKEDIVIWDCGVAIKEVNNAFVDSAVEFTEKQASYMLLLEREASSLNAVLNKYGELEASEINELPLIVDLRKHFQNKTTEGEKIPHIKVDKLMEWIEKYDNW